MSANDAAGVGTASTERWSTWGGAQGVLNEITLDATATALFVIDLQYLYHRDFGAGARLQALGTFETRRYMYERLEDVVVPHVQTLLTACRKAGIRVFYTRNCALASDGTDLPPRWRSAGKEEGVNWCAIGSKESEILDEVRPRDDEIVLRKLTTGVFGSTPIDAMLRNMGVKTLLFCGAATNYCVESSVREAGDHNYETVLVSDACAALNKEQERLAWEVLDGTYCRVMDTSEVLGRISRATDRSGATRTAI